MKKKILLFATIAGTIGVIMGAFGAHALKSKVPPAHLEAVKTGVLYLFIHVLAALWTTTTQGSSAFSGWIKNAGVAFMAGVLLFSGSLFLIGTSTLTGLNTSYIGFITPLGGVCFIGGWVCAGIGVWKSR
jgi:uncharacterized membrane protein YgdD (TMEM256/DUF423 family)